MTCIQCGKQTDTAYCPYCGQKQNIPRLSLKTFLHDFFSRIYGLDGAFPKTFLGLAKNPALVAQEYIKGIRGKYVGPVGYYFLMFAIFLLIVQVSDLTLADYLPKTEEYAESFIDDESKSKKFNVREISLIVKQTVFRNIQYVAVLMVPFVAFWCGVWFRKSKYNLLENIVFSFFIHAEVIIFNIIGFIFLAVSGYNGNNFMRLFSVIYCIWSISLFYAGKVRLGPLVKGLAAYVLAYISFILFLTVVVTLVLILRGGVT